VFYWGRLLVAKPGFELGALTRWSCGAILKLIRTELSVVTQAQEASFDAATLMPYVPQRRTGWKWVAAIAVTVAAAREQHLIQAEHVHRLLSEAGEGLYDHQTIHSKQCIVRSPVHIQYQDHMHQCHPRTSGVLVSLC
jgi:hypothetical protein